jgi:DNA-binding SARP family transcriptional activator
VLIYLASRPQARATREELIGLLWEGSSPHDARQALRQVV